MTVLSTKKPLENLIGEVIYSTSEMIIVQCYKEPETEKYILQIENGKIVKITSSYDTSYAAFGIITKINNSSVDNVHKPSALGLSASELEDLHPQLRDLLKKELEIYLFAYEDTLGNIIGMPPPKPMSLHDFVYIAENSTLEKLTEDISNIANIIKKYQLNPNLLIELVLTGYQLRKNNYKYLVHSAQELALVFNDEAHTLIQILKRLSMKK